MSTSRSRASSLTRRPTTPLRRISASSLRALSLSHSRSRATTTGEAGSTDHVEPPLQHLSQIFAELADAFSDLGGNLEALDTVNDQLDKFNESFASYLYGLRVTAYTADFDEAPTRVNFELAATRRPASPSGPSFASPPTSPNQYGNSGPQQDETTFITNDGDSFAVGSGKGNALPTGRGTGRGGSTTTTTRGGRGTMTSTRGGAASIGRGGRLMPMTKKKKEEMLAFADTVIQSLPLKYREQQPLRGETEKVVFVLKEYSQGVTMVEAQKATGVPTHRVNDALTALVRAKAAIKTIVQGSTTFRLDPNKFALE